MADAPTTPDSAETPDRAERSDAAPAATEVDGGARVAEAGHAYVGRTMDPDLKSAGRVTEPGAGVDDTPGDASRP